MNSNDIPLEELWWTKFILVLHRWDTFNSYYLSHNNFSGDIPESICNFDTTNGNITIDLSSNMLCGSIPDCLCYEVIE